MRPTLFNHSSQSWFNFLFIVEFRSNYTIISYEEDMKTELAKEEKNNLNELQVLHPKIKVFI